MRVVAALAVLVALVAPSLSLSECQWGPSYWCQSHTTAQQCRQVQYCQENVWKTPVKAPMGITCTICQLVAKYVQEFVEKNSTETEAENAVEDMCKALGAFKDECDELVKDYFPMIWDLLEQELSPDAICAQLGLCSSAAKPALSSPKAPKSIGCDVCELVAGYLDGFVKENKTESEAEAAVEEFCSFLGSLKSECDELVKTYFPMIWELLEQELEPNAICAQLGLCSSVAKPVKKPALSSPKAPKSIGCDVCELVAKYLDGFVKENKTESEAEAAVEEFCSFLGSLKSECDELVKTYFPVIWELLEQELEPNAICAQLGLCSSVAKPVKKPALSSPENVGCDLCKLVAGYLEKVVDKNTTEAEAEKLARELCNITLIFKDECNKLLDYYFKYMWDLLEQELDTGEQENICADILLCSGATKLALKPKENGAECELCDFVLNIVHSLVEKDSTKEEALEIVEQVCGVMGDLKAMCLDLITSNWNNIWGMVENEIEPGVICPLVVKGCTSQTVTPVKAVEAAPPQTMPKQSLCDICKLVVNFIKPYVDSNATKQEVEQALESLCGLLPSSISSECKMLIETYFPILWQLVVSELDNDQICVVLGLCQNATKTAVKTAPPQTMPKQSVCDICKLVVSFLKPYIDSNATEQEVEQALESLCNLLPSSISSECDAVVTTYFPLIWQLLESEFEGDQICIMLGLCQKTSEMVAKAALPPPRKLLKLSLCYFCKLVVNFAEPFVDNTTSEAKVQSDLDKLCGLFPSKYASECRLYVDTYFPIIWALLQEEVSGDQICFQLGFCNATKTALKAAPPQMMPKQSLCDICKLVVSFIKPYVDSNATKQEVEQALESVCNLLPSSISSECKMLVETYFPIIWQLVVSELDNDQICVVLGLCQNATKTAVKAAPPQTMPKQSLCDICKLVVSFIKPYVDSNSTKQEVEQDLEELCNLLPSNISSECDSFVEEYFPLIWMLLQQEVDSGKLCEMIGLCPNSNSVAVVAVKSPPPAEKNPKAGVLCIVCEFVMKEIESLLITNATKADIEAALEKVCDILPSTIRQDCDNFVKQYAPAIIQLLLDAVDPKVVCTILGVCVGDELRTPVFVEGSEECDVCKMAVSYLKTLIEALNTTKVDDLLDYVCSFMPTTIRSECTEFVNEYGPQLVQLVKEYVGKEIDPQAICQDLGLCSKSMLLRSWTKLL